MRACWVVGLLAAGCGPQGAGAPPPKPVPLPGHRPPSALAASLVPASLSTGCFAWSPQEPAVACIVGTESDQSGGTWSLVFVSDTGGRFRLATWGGLAPHPARALAPKERAVVDQRLADGDFRALPEPPVHVPPGPSATKVGALAVRLVREVEQHVKWPSGEWDVVIERLEARCPDRKSWLVLRETKLEGPIESTASARVLDDQRVLVFHQASWAMVGDKGQSAVATLVDLAACRAWTSEL